MAITIFFIFSTLFHIWAIEKAQKSENSTGFFRWIYGSIALKMISVVALSYYMVFVLKVENSLVILLIANYLLLTILHLITLKRHLA